MTELRVNSLSYNAAGRALVSNVSFTLAPGELIALLGANGAGKTSLLRTSLGLQKPSAGNATIDGTDTRKLAAAKRARKVSYLPQTRSLAWPVRVRDAVALGRFSHGATIARLCDEDAQAIDRALDACGLKELAMRRTDTLSGGELARVHCARAFAAEAPLLIADEPTTALDPRHQFSVMDLIARYVQNGGGALVVLHDLQLAVRTATRLLWMHEGSIVADGTPEDTLTSERLAQVYGVDAVVDGVNLSLKGAL